MTTPASLATPDPKVITPAPATDPAPSLEVPTKITKIIDDAEESESLDLSAVVIKAYKEGIKDGSEDQSKKVEPKTPHIWEKPCFWCGDDHDCKRCKAKNS